MADNSLRGFVNQNFKKSQSSSFEAARSVVGADQMEKNSK